jgi:carbamoylphosphate synthase large subunit
MVVSAASNAGGVMAVCELEAVLPPRVMLIAVENWPTGARFVRELRITGFDVAAVASSANLLHRMPGLKCYNHSALAPLRSIAHAIKKWSPQLLLCIDDRAVMLLHRLYERAAGLGANEHRALIERSLGDPTFYTSTLKKTKLISTARQFPLRCPETAVVTNIEELTANLQAIGLPAVLKVDGSSGGRGIRIARTIEQAVAALRDLQNWSPSSNRVHRLFDRVSTSLQSSCEMPAVSVQPYIHGRPANRAVACWNGKVLAGISVEAVEVSSETGPCTVVRTIDNDEMEAGTAKLVRALGLSGLCGFDFILDGEAAAWLIELNPRVTPTCHLVRNSDLIGALYTQVTGMNPVHQRDAAAGQVIALFPGEWIRERNSRYLLTSYHDVPWDEPQFVRACLETRPSKLVQMRVSLMGLIRSALRRGSRSAFSQRVPERATRARPVGVD